jgi:hypothetical protein
VYSTPAGLEQVRVLSHLPKEVESRGQFELNWLGFFRVQVAVQQVDPASCPFQRSRPQIPHDILVNLFLNSLRYRLFLLFMVSRFLLITLAYLTVTVRL